MTRIKNPSLSWNDNDTPRSEGFEDVYYNRKNGLAETNMVFLQGNNLPDAWQNRAQFTIAETGFGTGLNFLAAWKLFEETAKNGERLDFISTEQFPLALDDLRRALQPWHSEIGDERVDRFLAVYPLRIPGFHRRWVTDRVTLTLIFDDALRGFKQLETPIDAWFLDGFAPKRNGALWQPEIFAEMARLSHAATTLASFTAAGFVKRGLKEAGFSIKREKGFGYKYHRITGRFSAGAPLPGFTRPEKVTIIGAGLAGSACAHALQRRGVVVMVIDKEAHAAAQASGNTLGLINPRIEAQDNPRNDAGLSAFSFAAHLLQDLPETDYRKTGALHLFAKEEKEGKLRKIAGQNEWLEPHLQLRENGVFFADAGLVNTQKLVHALLGGNMPVYNQAISENALPAGPVILACGWGLKEFTVFNAVPLQPVRGQVSFVQMPSVSLAQPLLFGHYIAPLADGRFCLGASFERDQAEAVLKDEDDAQNIAAARACLPPADITLTHRWAQIRTASKDRFPVVGPVPEQNGLYVSGALGSHGIQFSLLQGEILACLLTGAPMPIGRDALNCLSITRFYKAGFYKD